MRIKGPLDYTENHRFYMFRDFALSPTDTKMLLSIYQPMIGAVALSYYMALYQMLPADKIGYANLEQQRKLFLLMDLPLGESGRVTAIEAASKCEAVGLIKTFKKYLADRDEWVYFYHLNQPAHAYDFFNNPHLTMLLRDKVGKAQLIRLRQELTAEEVQECRNAEVVEVSTPFYELFQLNAKQVDSELEQALSEMAPAVLDVPQQKWVDPIQVEELLVRLPRQSVNREHVAAFKPNSEALVFINFVAKKFGLGTVDVCRLLDEESMFWPDGTLDEELFQKQASLLYSQSNKQADERERRVAQATPSEEAPAEAGVAELYQEDVPTMLRTSMNKEQYNFLMRNQPYTQFVKHFFPGSVPDMVDKLFVKIDLNYKLPNEVINVLIHYLKAYDLSWNRPFVETIAADLLGKHVDTYEKAILYIREQVKAKARRQAPAAPRATSGRGGQGRMKPQIPVAEAPADAGVSDEAYLEILKKHQLMQGEDA